MFVLEKEFPFEASHQLMDHDGKCARLHGHSWKLRVYVEGDTLIVSGPKRGMVMDYGDIKQKVQPLIENYLDHYHLNDSLGITAPTSEYVAQWVFNMLYPLFGEKLVAVRVEETCTSACTFTPDAASWAPGTPPSRP